MNVRTYAYAALAFCIWLVAIGSWIALFGAPANAFAQVGWIALGLWSTTFPAWREGARDVLLRWSPILVALFVYDVIHTWITSLIPASHTTFPIHTDRALFRHLPTLALQHAIYHPHRLHVWDYVAVFVYISHFWFSLGIGLLLWKLRSPRFPRMVWAFVAVTTPGFIVYVLFPEVPPWMAAAHGALPTVHRIVPELLTHIHLGSLASTFETSTYAVDVAAMPSLHAAYPLLVTFLFWDRGLRVRCALVAYTLAMALSLVYLGEHYVVDEFAGWLLVAIVWMLLTRVRAFRDGFPGRFRGARTRPQTVELRAPHAN